MSTSAGPRVIEALVQAGAFESRYVRAGSGSRLVLLLSGQRRAWLDGSLLPQLAARYCVVVPEIPGGCAPDEVAQWLQTFLDGIGVERCAVVAEPDLAASLYRAARCDERIERFALLGPLPAKGDPDGPLPPPCPCATWCGAPDATDAEAESLVKDLAEFMGTPLAAAGRPRPRFD